jgi:D-alanyl-D-alanine carboxypeptidase (penicillin-binding protein 5/6)
MPFPRRAFLLALLLPAAAWAANARPQAAKSASHGGGYKGAIVMDAASGAVLFEENADVVNPPASMTKLMTFAVLYERLARGDLTLATPVTVTAADTRIGGTQVWLKEKETYPVEELIYAMMIQSANDAAYALGRTVAGSPEAFAEQMNAKARQIGLLRSTFRTAHGLPPSSRKTSEGDLSTPRDFALLARFLLQKTDVLKYSSVRQRRFGEGVRSPDKVIAMVNHNHLLGKVAGVDGLKTGFTNAAGFCLTATAVRNGRRIIVVTMGGTDKKARDLAVAELIERGFAALPPAAPAMAAPTVDPLLTPAPAPAAKPAAATAGDGSPVIRFAPTRK